MSANIARAYKQFLKEEGKRKAKNQLKQVASSGLLAPRNRPSRMDGSSDQMDTLISFVDEIRKYGGRSDG